MYLPLTTFFPVFVWILVLQSIHGLTLKFKSSRGKNTDLRIDYELNDKS